MFNSFRWRLVNALKSAETALSNDSTDYFRNIRYYIPFALTPYHKFDFREFERKIVSDVKNKDSLITSEDKAKIISRLCELRALLPPGNDKYNLYRRNPYIADKNLDATDSHVFFGTASRAFIIANGVFAYSSDEVGAYIAGAIYIIIKTIAFGNNSEDIICEKINVIYGIESKYSQSSHKDFLEKEFGL